MKIKAQNKMLPVQGVVFSTLKRKASMVYFRLASFWSVAGPVLICSEPSGCGSPDRDISGGTWVTPRWFRLKTHVIDHLKPE